MQTNLSDTFEDLLIYDDLFFDYFSTFNALPIFAQPLEYHRLTGAFRLRSCCSGSRTTKTHTPAFGLTDSERETQLEWARQTRLPFFVRSELFREMKLCKLLLQPTDLAGSSVHKSGNLTTTLSHGNTTSSENEFEYEADDDNVYASGEYGDDASEAPSRAVSLPAYLDQYRSHATTSSDKFQNAKVSKDKSFTDSSVNQKSDKRKSITDDDRSSHRSGVYSAPLNYDEYMKLPLHKLLNDYVAAGDEEDLDYDSSGQKRKPYVSFADEDAARKKRKTSKQSSSGTVTTQTGYIPRRTTSTNQSDREFEDPSFENTNTKDSRGKSQFESESTILIDPESEVIYYEADRRSAGGKSRGSVTTSASSHQSGEARTDDDVKSLEVKHKISYNRLKELMIGTRHGFREFIRFVSDTEGVHALRFWFDCETYRDAVSNMDGRGDTPDSLAFRNQLYKNVQTRYNMRLSEAAKAEIRRASQSNNLHAMNAVFVRVQHDVLKRIRTYWLPRFVIHKEYQLSKQSLADLGTLSASQANGFGSDKSQIHLHIVSSSGRLPTRNSTHALRQFLIENAFSLLHIHAFQHSLSFMLELLHSVPIHRVSQRNSQTSKQVLPPQATTENLVAQAQLYDMLLLSLAMDKACGRPFLTYLTRLSETDLDKSLCESLLSCARLAQDLIDYTMNESPYNGETIASQAVCSGVGPSSMFVLRRDYLMNLQSKYLTATAPNQLDLPDVVRDQLLQLFKFVSVNGLSSGSRSETAVRSNQIMLILLQFCFDRLWKFWLRYLQEDELEYLRWAPNPRKSDAMSATASVSTKQVTFSEVERTHDSLSTVPHELSDIVCVMVGDSEYFELEIMHDEHLIVKRKHITVPTPEPKIPLSPEELDRRRKRRLEVERLCKIAIKNAHLRRAGLLDRTEGSSRFLPVDIYKWMMQSTLMWSKRRDTLLSERRNSVATRRQTYLDFIDAVTPLTEEITNREDLTAEPTQTSMQTEEAPDEKFETSAVGQPGVPEFREIFNAKPIMRLFNKYLFDRQIKDISSYVFFYIDLSDYFAMTAGDKGKNRRDFQAKHISRTYFEKISKRYVELPEIKLNNRIEKEFGRPSTPLLKDIFTFLNEQITPIFRDFWEYQTKEKGVDMFALKNMSEKEFMLRQEESDTVGRIKNTKTYRAGDDFMSRLSEQSQFLPMVPKRPTKPRLTPEQFLKTLVHPPNTYIWREITRRVEPEPLTPAAQLLEFVKNTPLADVPAKQLTVRFVLEGTGKAQPGRDDKFDLLALLDQCVAGGDLQLKAFYFFKYLIKYGPINNIPTLERNLLFYVEVQKFKEHSHGHADLELLKRKVQSISDSFLDCLSPPPVQITISMDMHGRLMKAATRFASGRDIVPNLFDEAQFQVFKELLPYFTGFNKTWTETTTTQEKLTELILPYNLELQERREKFEQWNDPGVRAFQLPKPASPQKKPYYTPAQISQIAAQNGHAAAAAILKSQTQPRTVTVTFSLLNGVAVKDREKEITPQGAEAAANSNPAKAPVQA